MAELGLSSALNHVNTFQYSYPFYTSFVTNLAWIWFVTLATKILLTCTSHTIFKIPSENDRSDHNSSNPSSTAEDNNDDYDFYY